MPPCVYWCVSLRAALGGEIAHCGGVHAALCSAGVALPVPLQSPLRFLLLQPGQRLLLSSRNGFTPACGVQRLLWCVSLVTSEIDQLFVLTGYCACLLPIFPVDLSVFLDLNHRMVLYIWISCVCDCIFKIIFLLTVYFHIISDLEKSCESRTESHRFGCWPSPDVPFATSTVYTTFQRSAPKGKSVHSQNLTEIGLYLIPR